ncbi:50S ribosomal protein L24 [Sphingobacterium daejeonense]|nr:50S ribosomal protein L24 [Sphingobacterium daejeonense]
MAYKTNKTTHKIKIKKGDLVKVIAGNSKGVQGKVLQVIIDTNRAVVEGANIVKKHTKPSAAKPERWNHRKGSCNQHLKLSSYRS